MASVANQKKKKCGLIMPISGIDGCSPSHWDEVFQIIKEALLSTDFAVELVSNSDEIGIIQKRIVQNIYDNEIVVCDVSAKNPNVMFELGMRLAFDKPAIIIKDDQTNYSFDTAPIEHLEYPRELNHRAIQEFQAKLKDKVVATFEASKRPDYTTFLKHFGQFIVANIEEKPVAKEDYLLEVMSEFRIEIRALRNAITEQTGSSSNLLLHQHIANETRIQWAINNALRTENHLIEFIKSHFGHSINETILADLQNPNSQPFKELFKIICKNTYSHEYLGETKQIEEALIAAATRLQYLYAKNHWSTPE